MKLSATLFSMLIFFCAITAYAQNNSQPEIYEKTFTKCEHPPTFGDDSLALQTFFVNKLQNQIANSNGQIKISLIIDTAGKTACEYVENNSNLKMDKRQLNSMVNEMPNWNYAFQNGRKVKCIEFILLTFHENALSVFSKMGREKDSPF